MIIISRSRRVPTRRYRDESGAVAIVVAALALALFGLAALGVDLGNAMNRKQLTQNSADFAAMGGANGLPDTGTVTVQRVADYLNENQPSSDGVDDCNPDAGSSITPTMLTDGDELNGEVTFPSGTTRIRVVAPSARVQFGMAGALGFHDACVGSVAVARISSGNIGMAPFYATDACDQGPQVLKSDAGGPSIPFSVPTLDKDSETNSSVLSTVDPNPSPNQILVATAGAPDGPQITIKGTNLGVADIDKVGFFSSDQSSPKEAVPLASPAQTATSVTVNVPNDVAKYQDVWWIRVRSKTTSKWSDRAQARPLLVGDVTLSCNPESSSGNFGSIDLPWGGNDLQDLEKNISAGNRAPTTVLPWPVTPASPLPADNTCDSQALGIISTDTLSRENTNCVLSVTGLKAKPTYDGLLKNSTGRLMKDTSQACLDRGRLIRGSMNENSDVLSCFLKDDSLKLSDTVSYNGSDSLFTQALWQSPRFMLVPKLAHDPSGTKWMPISGVVPAFITDQPTGASRLSPLVSNTTDNGLVVENPNKLRAIRVFFFDIDALPPPPDGVKLQDYIGSGKKIVSLVD